MRRFVDEPHAGRLLDVVVLDRLRYPNGSAYFSARWPQRVGVTPTVVHNNCVIGHDSKVARFKAFGLWFADDALEALAAADDASFRCVHVDRLERSSAAAATSDAPVATMSGHRELVTALAVVGAHLVSASYDKTLRLWDLEVTAPLCALRGRRHDAAVATERAVAQLCLRASARRALGAGDARRHTAGRRPRSHRLAVAPRRDGALARRTHLCAF